MKDIAQIKDKFKSDFNHFLSSLKDCISCEDGQWTVKGFIDIYKNIYSVSSDTKLISKILETHLFPMIRKFADEIGYNLVLADKQNYYPDMTMINKEDERIKFAVDLKSTFRRNDNTVSFTLGSHGAYFSDRDGNKNIQFPYNQYKGHFCLGIVYSRTGKNAGDLNETGIFQVAELGSGGGDNPLAKEAVGKESLKEITSVIKSFDFFFAEKWKIASDSQGSGNTANIGSISNLDDIKNENGVFSKLGEEYFDLYWLNYGKQTILIDNRPKTVSNVWEFLKARNETDKFKLVGKGAQKNKLHL